MGQLVVKKVVRKGYNTTNKFLPRYSGPYKVVKVLAGGTAYKLKYLTDPYNPLIAHHTQLKRWGKVPQYLEEHPPFWNNETDSEKDSHCEDGPDGPYDDEPPLVNQAYRDLFDNESGNSDFFGFAAPNQDPTGFWFSDEDRSFYGFEPSAVVE